MNLSQEEIISFAKWLRKESGIKGKRFVYANKLTKLGSLAVTFAMISLSFSFINRWKKEYERNIDIC